MRFYILSLVLVSCGDIGRISNQGFHCMTEGGDDYCRPQPGPTGAPGKDSTIAGPTGAAGRDGKEGTSGATGADGYSIVTASEVVASGDYFCYYGGVRLRIARDTNRSNTWDQADSEQQIVNVCNGRDGSNGTNGSDGTNGVDGTDGSPGQNGSDGVDGADGRDGEDGTDGRDGADAPTSPFLPVEIVDPCGDAPGVFDEVFIRLANGKLLASFSDNSNGQNTRFSILVAGNYMTTDGSHCYFTVDSNNQLLNQHY